MTARRTWIDRGSDRPTIVSHRTLPGGYIGHAMRDFEGSGRPAATEISELS